MNIEIHIFPDNFPISHMGWQKEMNILSERIRQHILNSTVNAKGYAVGETTLLDPNGMIIATVDIRRE